MIVKKIKTIRRETGSCMVLAIIFLVIFASLSVAVTSYSSRNLAISVDQQKSNEALAAASSGVEFASSIVKSFASIDSTGDTVSDSQANSTWNAFVAHVRSCGYGGVAIASPTRINDSNGGADQLSVPLIAFNSTGGAFSLRFLHYDSDPANIVLESTGTDGNFTRKICMDYSISKDAQVLEYAIASRGRMIITGDTTIEGSVFSTWYQSQWHAPFELTSDSTINGTVNVTVSASELYNEGNQMETLDENWNPILDEDGNRVISAQDTLQGSVEGVNYDIPGGLMPGMDEDDYDTSSYRAICTEIPAASHTRREYFPHVSGDYTVASKSWSSKLYRHVYQNQTFTNARLPKGRNALFENCTFEGVLYIDSDSWTSSTSRTNNVRFNNCQFNGVIVSSIPKNSYIQWRQNCLYFTGSANFDNQYMQEATILAPNFNVNLGNTSELEEGSESHLTGAVVGGIVDVRGNARIDGTIISMYDTSPHSNGYVTNIGFADDGGSEGGDPGDIGTITIVPPENKMLPGGIISDIIIVPKQETYREVL